MLPSQPLCSLQSHGGPDDRPPRGLAEPQWAPGYPKRTPCAVYPQDRGGSALPSGPAWPGRALVDARCVLGGAETPSLLVIPPLPVRLSLCVYKFSRRLGSPPRPRLSGDRDLNGGGGVRGVTQGVRGQQKSLCTKNGPPIRGPFDKVHHSPDGSFLMWAGEPRLPFPPFPPAPQPRVPLSRGPSPHPRVVLVSKNRRGHHPPSLVHSPAITPPPPLASAHGSSTWINGERQKAEGSQTACGMGNDVLRAARRCAVRFQATRSPEDHLERERGGGETPQLPGPADAHTAHPATSRTAPAHQPLGSANAETTPAGAPAAAADRTQRPDATCEGKNG